MNIKTLSDTFWSPTFWLPPNITWADVEPNNGSSLGHTNYRHLAYSIPFAVVFLAVRYLLERLLFKPVGLYLGVSHHRAQLTVTNPTLEAAYLRSKASKNPLQRDVVVSSAKRLDWSERQVERWFRTRRSLDKLSKLDKFCETCWKGFYSTLATVYGLCILWDKPWFWDFELCYHGYPHQGITADIWWYHILTLSHYLSVTISQFTDVKRKDFWQMFTHHVATILLSFYGWITNFHRIGACMFLVHDCSDIFLETAKLFKYAKYHATCTAFFVTFMLVWMVTRCYIYPFRILVSVFVLSPKIIESFPAFELFNLNLLLLMALHLFWTYLILLIAWRSLKSGQTGRDVRSSSSDDVSEGTGQASNAGQKINYFKKVTSLTATEDG